MTALALMGLLPDGAVVSGAMRFEGRDLAGLGEAEMQKLRGDRIAMIFQEPMSALNPLHRIGAQVAEPLVLHRGMTKAAAWAEAVRLLDRVKLRDPERIARAYPFALSGGERQRAMIAMALSCGPELIIADEPTTALDVTVQAKILDLLGEPRRAIEHGDAAGQPRPRGDCAPLPARPGDVRRRRSWRSGPVDAVLRRARHPYTRALLEARPRPGAPRGERLRAIAGAAPSSASAPIGCPVRRAMPADPSTSAARPPPPTIELEADHRVRCHRVDAEGRLT